MILLFADRLDMVEAVLSDIFSGHFPNFYKELGLGAEKRLNKNAYRKRLATRTLAIVAIIALFI